MEATFLNRTHKVDKQRAVNDYYWCTRLGVERFMCGSKLVDRKSGGPKGCSD